MVHPRLAQSDADAPSHTSGPWEYVPGTEHHGPYVTHAFGGTVADCYMMSRPGPLNHEPTHPVPFMAEMAEPNARLIAAAPDLLEVLQRAVAKNMLVEYPEWWGDVYTAIAKATGRQP